MSYPLAFASRSGSASTTTFGPATGDWQFPGPSNVPGCTCTITVANPSGAYVLIQGGLTAWCNGTGAVLYQYVSIDGGAFQQVCLFYFNSSSDHQDCGNWAIIQSLSAGSHSFQLGAYDANVLCNMDINDTAFISAIELA